MNTGNDLFELLKAISNAGISYVVCGGIACVLHGVERATYDLDVAVAFDKGNLEKLLDLTKAFGLIPRMPEPVTNLFDESTRNKWINEKGAVVYTFVSDKSPLQLDIFLQYPISFDLLLMNSETFVIDDIRITTSSISDLITAKSSMPDMREKDIYDIRELEKLNESKKQ